MPSRELELFAKKVLVVAALGVLLWVMWEARGVLVLVFIAAILAAGIAPAVHRIRALWRFYFHRPLARGPAVMIVYLPFVVLALVLCVLVAPRFVDDMRELGARMPELVEKNILVPLEAQGVPVGRIREELRGGIELPRSRVFAYMRTTATAMASIIAVLFLVAYMLIDADRLRNLFLLVYDPEVRGERRRVLNRMSGRMSSWLSAQLLLSAIIGVTTFIGFTIIDLPYALPLAILAAVGELIPMIGPTVGAIPALAIALLHSSWQFWAVLIFAFVLQKLENYLIVPRVMANRVQVSPLAVFIAFLIGASLLGVPGALIAIPVTAILQVAFDEAFVQRRERRQDLERPGTLLRKVD